MGEGEIEAVAEDGPELTVKKTFIVAFLGAALSLFGRKLLLISGWTIDQCQQAYGQPVTQTPPNESDSEVVYTFDLGDYQIYCRLINVKIAEVNYSRLDDAPLSKQEIKDLIR